MHVLVMLMLSPFVLSSAADSLTVQSMIFAMYVFSAQLLQKFRVILFRKQLKEYITYCIRDVSLDSYAYSKS